MVRRRTASDHAASAILTAASRMVHAGEISQMSIRTLAQRATVAPMTIYNHFDGIGGVFEALWCDGFERLATAIRVPPNEPWADLRDAGIAYRRFAHDNAGHYRLMFLEVAAFEPTERAAIAAANAFGSLVDLVERLGELRPGGGTSTDVAQVVWSAVHGFVALEILGRNFATDSDATFEQLLLTVQHGLQ